MKNWLQETCFFLVMSLVWGVTIIFIIIGPSFMLLDWLANTQLTKILDLYVLGYKSLSFVYLCIIGMPFAWLTK